MTYKVCGFSAGLHHLQCLFRRLIIHLLSKGSDMKDGRITTQAEFDKALEDAKAAGSGTILLGEGTFALNETLPQTIHVWGLSREATMLKMDPVVKRGIQQ